MNTLSDILNGTAEPASKLEELLRILKARRDYETQGIGWEALTRLADDELGGASAARLPCYLGEIAPPGLNFSPLELRNPPDQPLYYTRMAVSLLRIGLLYEPRRHWGRIRSQCERTNDRDLAEAPIDVLSAICEVGGAFMAKDRQAELEVLRRTAQAVLAKDRQDDWYVRVAACLAIADREQFAPEIRALRQKLAPHWLLTSPAGVLAAAVTAFAEAPCFDELLIGEVVHQAAAWCESKAARTASFCILGARRLRSAGLDELLNTLNEAVIQNLDRMGVRERATVLHAYALALVSDDRLIEGVTAAFLDDWQSLRQAQKVQVISDFATLAQALGPLRDLIPRLWTPEFADLEELSDVGWALAVDALVTDDRSAFHAWADQADAVLKRLPSWQGERRSLRRLAHAWLANGRPLPSPIEPAFNALSADFANDPPKASPSERHLADLLQKTFPRSTARLEMSKWAIHFDVLLDEGGNQTVVELDGPPLHCVLELPKRTMRLRGEDLTRDAVLAAQSVETIRIRRDSWERFDDDNRRRHLFRLLGERYA